MTDYRVKVPGKMMFAGEYSVLRGGRAFAVTLDSYLTLRVAKTSSENQRTLVYSNLWDMPKEVIFESDGEDYGEEPLLEAVHTCQHAYNIYPSEIVVDSELEVSHGIGSSSAVRLATCLAFDALFNETENLPSWEIVRRAYVLQRAHQGRASGYDVATQYLGGAVSFKDESTKVRSWPTHAESLAEGASEVLNKYFRVFVGGKGAPTKETLRSAHEWLCEKNAMTELMERNEELIDAIEALVEQDSLINVEDLIKKMEAQRQCFSSSPTFPQHIGQQLGGLPGLGVEWSYKATGAGGEDAILVATLPSSVDDVISDFAKIGWSPLGVPFTFKGARVEKLEVVDA